jgi:hypothetical protein
MLHDRKKAKAEDLFAIQQHKATENVHAAAGEGNAGMGGGAPGPGMMTSVSTPAPIADMVAQLMAAQWTEDDDIEGAGAEEKANQIKGKPK